MENTVRHHSTAFEARVDFKAALDEVIAGDRWMAAVWSVRDGKVRLNQVTTSNFPKGDFLAAVGQLAMNRFEQLKADAGVLPSDPLPKADFPFHTGTPFCSQIRPPAVDRDDVELLDGTLRRGVRNDVPGPEDEPDE